MSYDSTNLFARILRGELPCKKVYEDDDVLAFKDIQPAAPVHVLVIPKQPFRSFHDFAQAQPDNVGRFFAAVQKIAAELGIAESGYRLIMNHGPDAFQSVHHFHVHLLAGKPLGGLLASDNLLR